MGNVLGEGGFFGGLAEGHLDRMKIDEARAQRQDARAEKTRQMYEKLTGELAEAMLEPDDGTRQMAVQSLLDGVEQLRGKPINKNLKSLFDKRPEDALAVLDNVRKAGVDPRIIFNVGDDPLLFGHAMLALGKAKRERANRD